MRCFRSRSSAAIGTRFCGARGSTCGSDATSGRTAAVRSAIADRLVLRELARDLTAHDAGPGMAVPEHREPHVPRVPLVVGDREHRCALARSELRHHRVPFRFEVRDAVALDVADRGVRRELVQRAVGDHEALGGERGGRLALGAPHLRVELDHQTGGVVGRARGGGDAGFEIDGRHLLGVARRRAPPTARCARTSTSERRAERSHIVAPTANVPQRPGVGPAAGSSRVSRASTRRTPSTNAIRSTPSSAPSIGAQSSCLDRGVDRALGRGEGVVLVERGAVLGVPPLDEDARHGAHPTDGARRLPEPSATAVTACRGRPSMPRSTSRRRRR